MRSEYDLEIFVVLFCSSLASPSVSLLAVCVWDSVCVCCLFGVQPHPLLCKSQMSAVDQRVLSRHIFSTAVRQA